MTCEACGDERAFVRRICRSYGKGTTLMIIEIVPIVRCPGCAESYVTARTLHEIERIKLHPRPLMRRRLVSVASFP